MSGVRPDLRTVEYYGLVTNEFFNSSNLSKISLFALCYCVANDLKLSSQVKLDEIIKSFCLEMIAPNSLTHLTILAFSELLILPQFLIEPSILFIRLLQRSKSVALSFTAIVGIG